MISFRSLDRYGKRKIPIGEALEFEEKPETAISLLEDPKKKKKLEVRAKGPLQQKPFKYAIDGTVIEGGGAGELYEIEINLVHEGRITEAVKDFLNLDHMVKVETVVH